MTAPLLDASAQAEAESPAEAGAWALVWSDEFEGDRIDPAKWDFDVGNGFFDYRSHQWIEGWGNEELQYYTREPDNAVVKDGLLTLRALKEPLHGCGYTSARLKTRSRDGKALFAQQYGRFEFRAKVPSGKGLWPALWLLPLEDKYGGWAASGEIDVMEIIGDQPGKVLSSLHFGSSFPKRHLVTHTHDLPDGGTVGDWHVYTVEWTPGQINWWVDDRLSATQNFWWSCSKTQDGSGLEPGCEADLNRWPAPFDQPFYLVMNVAVGGNFPGLPNPQTSFPAEMVIDYVRVYQRVGGYGETLPRGTGKLPFDPAE